jgi:hypothetical protein
MIPVSTAESNGHQEQDQVTGSQTGTSSMFAKATRAIPSLSVDATAIISKQQLCASVMSLAITFAGTPHRNSIAILFHH